MKWVNKARLPVVTVTVVSHIVTTPQPGPEVIKYFMLNLAEHEILPAHKC